MNIKEYAAVLGVDLHDTSFSGVQRISESVDLDHGIASYYLFTPILLLTGKETIASVLYWHVYTYILWFLGVIGLYSVLKSVCNSQCTPIIGVLIYFFTPRMYAEGHYNNKDIVLLSLTFIVLACFCKLIKRGKTREIIASALASGFLINCKIVGLAIWGLTGLFGVGYVLVMTDRKIWMRKITDLILTAILSLLVFFVLTPAMWHFPVGYIEYCMTNSTNFSRWSQSYLFNGAIVTPIETGVPRLYLIQWILMTTPVYVIILFLTSIGLFIRNMIAKKKTCSDQELFYILFIITFIIPVLVSVIKAPTLVLYNGWRHNYYLYAYIVLCACYTVDLILEGFKLDVPRLVVAGITVVGFIMTGVDMMMNRSYEYMYYNPVARVFIDTEGFEADYWNVAVVPAMKAFADRDEKMTIAPKGYAASGQLKFADFGDFVLVDERKNADYYLFNTSMMIEKDEMGKYSKVFSFQKYGHELCAIYKEKR